MRLLLLLTVLLAGCATPKAAEPPAKPAAQVVEVQAMRFSRETKAGLTSALTFKLRNDGDAPSAPIEVNINSEYFDGFILRTSEPKSTVNGKGSSFRTLKFPAIPPGAEQSYSIQQQANTPGEYKFWGYIADGQREVTKWSDRAVVLR